MYLLGTAAGPLVGPLHVVVSPLSAVTTCCAAAAYAAADPAAGDDVAAADDDAAADDVAVELLPHPEATRPTAIRATPQATLGDLPTSIS
jgi:hypothetical protein